MFEKKDFPQLQHMENKGITYLDSAATSLKLESSAKAQYDFDTSQAANVHRGAHQLSSEATNLYEKTRLKTAQYLNCNSSEIVFTKGTTESVNLIAQSFEASLTEKDSILITEMEHHANLLPWQRLSERTGARLLFCSVNPEGELNLEEVEETLKNNNVKIFSFTHVSNTLGTVLPVKKLIALSQKYKALSFIDGAQAVSMLQPNIKELSPDFYTFSAHKIFGPFGLGILYIKDISSIKPYQLGGAIIENVDLQSSTFLKGSQKLEPGTPNISAVISFSKTLDFLSGLNFQDVQNHEKRLLTLARAELQKLQGFKEVGTSSTKLNILSFYFEGVNSSDLCDLLDEQGVAVRAGHHCTQPLLKKFGLSGCLRASFSIYNTKNDIQKLITATQKALRILQ